MNEVKLRSVPFSNNSYFSHGMLDLIQKHASKEGLHATCLSCLNFDEKAEYCNKFSARPPARVIAFSCESYDDNDDIPF